MNQYKMYLLKKLFNTQKIRMVWDKEEEKYYISVVCVIAVLFKSVRPRKY